MTDPSKKKDKKQVKNDAKRAARAEIVRELRASGPVGGNKVGPPPNDGNHGPKRPTVALPGGDRRSVNPSQAVIRSSHQTAATEAGGSRLKKFGNALLASAEKFLRERGIETLISLGTALLLEGILKDQISDPTVVPAGTVLGYIDLYPNFATQNDPNAGITRLSRVASTFMRWKFAEQTDVVFVPSAGALNNGQIGMFITSDPRYEVTVTGQSAVRLIHEFSGQITQISQPMRLRVPSRQDWLYVEDAHESDIRFTRQGTLWIMAASDLDMTTIGPSLGEVRLDYTAYLKDNSVDGAVVTPYVPDRTLLVGNNTAYSLNVAPVSGAYTWFFGRNPLDSGNMTYTSPGLYGPTLMTYLNNCKGCIEYVTPTVAGVPAYFRFNELGVYRVTIFGSFDTWPISGDLGNCAATLHDKLDNGTLVRYATFLSNTPATGAAYETNFSCSFFIVPSVVGEQHSFSLLMAGAYTATVSARTRPIQIAVTQLTATSSTSLSRRIHGVRLEQPTQQDAIERGEATTINRLREKQVWFDGRRSSATQM